MAQRIIALSQLCLIFFLFSSCSFEEQKVTTKEMSLFITPKDLNELFEYEYPLSKEYEKTTKSGSFGEKEYTYEYTAPDSTLFISINLDYARKSSDAIISYGAYDIGTDIGVNVGDLEAIEKDTLFSYGDASTLKELRSGGKPYGNIFMTRKGSMIYHILITGLYIDDKELWNELVLPKLKAASAYEPE